MNSKQLARQSGFTLVELMVVVVILGLLAGVGSVVFLRNLEDSQNDIAKTKCNELEEAMEGYLVRKGSLPSPDEVIAVMVEEGYLKKDKVTDPWDEPFYIREDDQGNYKVFSKGKDKTEDTEDDISASGKVSESGGSDF